MAKSKNKETTKVYTVDGIVNVGGTRIAIVEIQLTQSINAIPFAQMLLPLNAFDSANTDVTVYKTQDPVNDIPESKNTYMICKDAEDGNKDVGIRLMTREANGAGGVGQESEFRVSGWKITHVALQPQSRVSPGGVLVVASHPMCDLLNSPGFFYAPGADYEKILKDKEPKDIIEAADAMLDAIYKVIHEKGYTKEKMQGTDNYETLVSGAKVRLGDYIMCDSGAAGFPYENSIKSATLKQYYSKAARTAFALNFACLPDSVPFRTLLNLCGQIGLYVSPGLDGNEKAKLKVLNPWTDREKGGSVKNEEVYSARTTRDTDPICGIRFLAGSKNGAIMSTLSSLQPQQKNTKTTGGEVVYYFNKVGRMINTSLPSFLEKIFSIMFRLYKKGRVTGYGGGGKKVKHGKYEDPKDNIKSFGLSAKESENVIDSLQRACAKTAYVVLHRRTQSASVTKPFIDADFPELGTYIKFSAGTGGDNVQGMLVQNVLSASCSQGVCTVTHTMAYCGDVAVETVKSQAKGGGTETKKKPLENELWKKSSGGSGGGK